MLFTATLFTRQASHVFVPFELSSVQSDAVIHKDGTYGLPSVTTIISATNQIASKTKRMSNNCSMVNDDHITTTAYVIPHAICYCCYRSPSILFMLGSLACNALFIVIRHVAVCSISHKKMFSRHCEMR